MIMIRGFQVLWIYYFYIDEKMNKVQFIHKYIQNQKLKDWKKLLQNVLPNQILIVTNKSKSAKENK